MGHSGCSSCGSPAPSCGCGGSAVSVITPSPRWSTGFGHPQQAGYLGDSYVDQKTGHIWQRELDRWVDTGVSFSIPSNSELPDWGVNQRGSVLAVSADGQTLYWTNELNVSLRALMKKFDGLELEMKRRVQEVEDRANALAEEYKKHLAELASKLGHLENLVATISFRHSVETTADLPSPHASADLIYYVLDEQRFYQNTASRWVPISQAPYAPGRPATTMTTQPINGVAGHEQLVIVDVSARGTWGSHAGMVGYWDGLSWSFRAPYVNELHVVEDKHAIYKWNGLTWVKVMDLTGVTTAPQHIFVGPGPLGPPTSPNWGFALGTIPDPMVVEPQPGDIYIDTQNDRIHALT